MLITTVATVAEAKEKYKYAVLLFGERAISMRLTGAWVAANGDAIWHNEHMKVVALGNIYAVLDDHTDYGAIKAKPDPDAPDWRRPAIEIHYQSFL